MMTCVCTSAATVSGGVSQNEMLSKKTNRVIDASTNMPIANAKVSLPKYNYSTYTDSTGNFEMDDISGVTILSVEKDGYRPFSLTVNDKISFHFL